MIVRGLFSPVKKHFYLESLIFEGKESATDWQSKNMLNTTIWFIWNTKQSIHNLAIYSYLGFRNFDFFPFPNELVLYFLHESLLSLEHIL